jgi:polyhydroxybutyrate depolymerase
MSSLMLSRFVGGLLIGCLLLWVFAGVSAPRLHSQSGRNETLKFDHGGLPRISLIHVPSGYDGKTPLPVVLSFHGRHGEGKDQQKLSHFDEVSDRHRFLVVYPDGIGKSWNALHGTGEAESRGVDDVGFVRALLDRLAERYVVDKNRIYASGMSNGGFFAHRLGCELSERFAAIASVAGQMSPALAKICRPQEPVAVLDIHGTADRIVPYKGGKTDGGGSLLSAEETVSIWRRLNKSAGEGETTTNGQVVCRTYQGGTAPVRFCTVTGAGHTWPGGFQYLPRLLVGATNRDVDASEMIWQFFAENPKRR